MTPAPDRIRADVTRTLEANGIAPRRAMKAAVRLVRGLALDERPASSDPCETLYNMRDRIAELLQDRDVAEAMAELIAGNVIDWLRKSWGGRTLTVRWWGFCSVAVAGRKDASDWIDGVLLPEVVSDPVKSRRGRELRAVVWVILAEAPPFMKGGLGGICRIATEIAALVEQEWATIYVPKGEEIDRQARDKKIFNTFGGLGNIEKVTVHGVSQSTAYAINKRFTEAKEKREQPGLW